MVHIHIYRKLSNTLTEIIASPEDKTVFKNEQAMFTCETNGADFTTWIINGTGLGNLPTEITDDLNIKNDISGDNILSTLLIQARVLYNGITVQCVAGNFGNVPVKSEVVTLTIIQGMLSSFLDPIAQKI